MVIGYDWRNRDIIRRERANGFIAYPNYVESGCNVNISLPDQVSVSAGIVHAGSFRTPIPAVGPWTLPTGSTYYIYATLTAQFDGLPRLTNVTNQQFEYFTSPQTFLHPKYGVLIAIVGTNGTTIPTSLVLLSQQNLGLPVQQADYFSLNQKTVGPTGCDYDNLSFALNDAPDDTTLVCYPGADYNLTRTPVSISGKKLRVVAAQHIDPRNFQGGGQDIILVTTGGPFFTLYAATIDSGADVYFKGFNFESTQANGLFWVAGNSNLTFDSCRLYDTAIAVTNFIWNNGGARVSFLECWVGNNGNAVSKLYLQDNDALSTTQLFTRETTFNSINGDGVHIQDGDYVILDSEFLNQTVGTPNLYSFRYETLRSPSRSLMQECFFDAAQAAVTAFSMTPIDPNAGVDCLGCVFRGRDSLATALEVNNGTLYWDSASRIYDDVAQVSVVAPPAIIINPRTPIYPWETVSFEDLYGGRLNNDAEQNTSSTTYVSALSGTLAAYLPPGTYFVDWSYEFSHTNRGNLIHFQIFAGGTLVSEHASLVARNVATYPNAFQPAAGVGWITWGGGTGFPIAVNWRTTAPNAYVRRLRIRVWRVY